MSTHGEKHDVILLFTIKKWGHVTETASATFVKQGNFFFCREEGGGGPTVDDVVDAVGKAWVQIVQGICNILGQPLRPVQISLNDPDNMPNLISHAANMHTRVQGFRV